MCKNPEAGKVLDTFEKRIKGKCDWNMVQNGKYGQQGGFIVSVYRQFIRIMMGMV